MAKEVVRMSNKLSVKTKHNSDGWEYVEIDDRYKVYPDGIVYDNAQSIYEDCDIPIYVFQLRDFIMEQQDRKENEDGN
jgi:hypothetical protein